MKLLSKKLLIPLIIFSIIIGFVIYVFVLHPPRFSAKVEQLRVISVQESYLHVKALIKITNNWIFSVSVNGGYGTIFINEVELGFFKIPSTTFSVGENEITVDLFLKNNTIVDILPENTIMTYIKVDTAFGAFEIKNTTQMHFEEDRKLLEIIDAFSLPKGRFLLILRSNFTSPHMLNVNYTLDFIGKYNETVLFYANGNFNISWEDFPLIVQIPSNDSLNTLIRVFDLGEPIDIIGNITLSYENWLSTLRLKFKTTFPRFTPSFNITVTEVDYDLIHNEFYIHTSLYIPNNFSIEANISEILVKIYTDSIFIGKAIAYNQTILPKTINAINITIIISGDNASEIIKHKGRIYVRGQIVLRIFDTTFIIHVEKHYQIQL